LIISKEVLLCIEQDFYLFLHKVSVQNDQYINDKLDRVIFEGAQGLLLDQDYGTFPHVTRSNTGLKNVRALVGDAPLDVKYVTRAYTTRHGAGPLPFELPEKPYPGIEDKTNITGGYQGSLRFSYLNLDDTSEAVKKDKQYVLPGDKVEAVVTCMDQLPEHAWIISDRGYTTRCWTKDVPSLFEEAIQ
jgi:adenylosuccinate synthase